MQPGGPGVRECSGQARRDREDDAPVIVLVGNYARLASFDEFLEAAARQKAFPLDHRLFGIEVPKESDSNARPGPVRRARPADVSSGATKNFTMMLTRASCPTTHNHDRPDKS